MIRPYSLPPDAYFDDPAEKIDQSDSTEIDRKLISAKASDALTRCNEWITRGRSGATNRSLRADIVLLSITPHFLPTKRPSAAWIAKEHNISRQRVSELWREFSAYIGESIQFRGQRFRNRRSGAYQRRGRVRQGTEGPQPGPVAGA